MAIDPAQNDPAPHPHASAEEVEAAYKDTKLAQVLYHDWEAGTYDEKWSISYDDRCITYATDRFRAAAGDVGPYEHALELGCGTGFFLLNLMQGDVIKKGSVTDLSPGMVEVALRNAEHLGLDVDGRVADAERIPYDDNTFDLVVGQMDVVGDDQHARMAPRRLRQHTGDAAAQLIASGSPRYAAPGP